MNAKSLMGAIFYGVGIVLCLVGAITVGATLASLWQIKGRANNMVGILREISEIEGRNDARLLELERRLEVLLRSRVGSIAK